MNNDSFLVWQSACATDVGKVRKVNEDACLDLPELGLWVVADGMGGHMAGDVASRMIVESCQQIDEPSNLETFIAEVQNRLQEVNRNLIQMATQQYNDSTIGSTVVALIAYERRCACLWVGDSRIYRVRDNKLEQLTRDHSVVEEYIADGIMTPQDAYNSSVANALTRAIGAQDELSIDVKIEEMQDGDTFLLCSDGLYREVSDEEMIQLITRSSDCAIITNNLLEHALHNGAKDNVTVSVVQIKNAYS